MVFFKSKRFFPKRGIIFDASSRSKRNCKVFFVFLVLIISLFGLIFFPRFAYSHFPVLIHITRPQPTKLVYLPGESVSISLNVQNVNPVGFNTPLCVREVVAGRSYHLGCVPEVYFAPFNGGSRFAFNVTRPAHTPGWHLIIFSYRDIYGRWHEILDSGHHLMRASYWVN